MELDLSSARPVRRVGEARERGRVVRFRRRTRPQSGMVGWRGSDCASTFQG